MINIIITRAPPAIILGATQPAPKILKPSGKYDISLPLPNISAKPRTIIIIPIVAIKGGTPVRTTVRPFINPTAKPVINARLIATQMGKPAAKTVPAMQAQSARIEPTDRSSPPEIRTTVVPSAIIASTED